MDLEQRLIELERELIETRKAAATIVLGYLDAAEDLGVRAHLVERFGSTKRDMSPEAERIQRLISAKLGLARH